MENAAILARIPFTRGREGIAWANNVRPYGIDCADRIQTVRRGRRTLRYNGFLTIYPSNQLQTYNRRGAHRAPTQRQIKRFVGEQCSPLRDILCRPDTGGAPSRRTLRHNECNSQVLCRISRPTSCAARLSPRGPSLALRAIHLVPRLRR